MASIGRRCLVALGLSLHILLGACQAMGTPTAAPVSTPPTAPATPIQLATPVPSATPLVALTPTVAGPAASVAPRPGMPTIAIGTTIGPTPVPPTPYAGPSVALDEPFALKIGQTLTVAGSSLQLTFSAMAEDSRCPRDVTCVWSGRAVVTLTAMQPSERSESLTLATCCPAEESSRLRYAGHDLRLLRVLPYPLRHDVTIRPEEYVVELRVTRATSA